MSYGIELRPGLNDEIMRLPLPVQQSIQAALIRLSENPSLARPSTLPDYPPGPMFLFEHEEPDRARKRYVILFKYTADERRLWISHIVPE